MKNYIFIFLLVGVWSCEKDKYDFIDEGKRFNKSTGEVEYKVQNRWVVEKEFIKHQKSNDAIIDEVKKILKNVTLASRMLKQAKNELTYDIERLVNGGYLNIDKSISEMWTFSSDEKGTLVTAVSEESFPRGSGIKIFYDTSNDNYLVTK